MRIKDLTRLLANASPDNGKTLHFVYIQPSGVEIALDLAQTCDVTESSVALFFMPKIADWGQDDAAATPSAEDAAAPEIHEEWR